MDLLLKIWGKLCHKHTDWRMVVVGDGDELKNFKQQIVLDGLINISFEGKQEPKKYYQEASIYAMTSASEGFGIVLIEAIQFGVIPFAFNSFCSVRDIIDDGVNGILIKPFNTDEYAHKLSILMTDPLRLNEMANKSKEKAKNFSIENIGAKWIQLFETL